MELNVQLSNPRHHENNKQHFQPTKIPVGSTPGGLVNVVSDAYGGWTSDRQIVEHSNIVQLCEPGDSVMADKGFNVQNLFARMDVTVNVHCNIAYIYRDIALINVRKNQRGNQEWTIQRHW